MGAHGGKRQIKKLIKAYEAAWARLQHEQPGYIMEPSDVAFSRDLLGWLLFHRAMLIGEVISQLYRYLYSNPAANERSEFSHILVDEYQDLNRAEQGVIDLISDMADVCIVGDDDQSIYSFKHAHPDGIRQWLTVNVGADDLGLDDCRRCPTRVVDMANSLIGNNRIRPVPRALVPMPANGPGDVRIVQYQTLAREVAGVAELIRRMVATGTPPGDILVLAQRGAIGTPIYEALERLAVPVRSYYAEAELDTPHAQRAFALFKLFVNRDDLVALRWLIGVDGSNWHAAGYRRVRERCEVSGDTPWGVLTQLRDGTLSLPHTRGVVEAFGGLIATLDGLEALPDLATVIDHLFPDGEVATRKLREIAIGVLGDIPADDREALLEEVIQKVSQPDIPSEIEDVRIMSLHKSKGLSSPVTIIAGCVEGLLPMRPDDSLPPAEQVQYMEEQRRLFYVGITRVKAVPAAGKLGTLVLTYSQRMPVGEALASGITPAQQRFGIAMLHASRFIAELGPSSPIPILV
jgi:superfamily I DNA/RNA helicase